MKTIFTRVAGLATCWLLLAFSLPTKASNDPVRDTLNYVFARIDKSKVPTGYLEEYGYQLLPFKPYTGAIVDSNRVSITTWRALYTTLYTARIFGSTTLPRKVRGKFSLFFN